MRIRDWSSYVCSSDLETSAAHRVWLVRVQAGEGGLAVTRCGWRKGATFPKNSSQELVAIDLRETREVRGLSAKPFETFGQQAFKDVPRIYRGNAIVLVYESIDAPQLRHAALLLFALVVTSGVIPGVGADYEGRVVEDRIAMNSAARA